MQATLGPEVPDELLHRMPFKLYIDRLVERWDEPIDASLAPVRDYLCTRPRFPSTGG